MDIIFLNGKMPNNEKKEILKNTKGEFQFAAEILQERIINCLSNRENIRLKTLSAPFINSYPFGYKKLYYKASKKTSKENYVSFFNLWGIRNISRMVSLKKRITQIYDKNKETYILVYSPHVPFLETARYLKRKYSNIKIILILPDLPQFVSLGNNKSNVYKILKKYDIKKFYKLSNKFDGYILLTESMNEFVNTKKEKPYMIMEGIVSNNYINTIEKNRRKEKNANITIVYTGTLHEKFGIKKLIDSFLKIEEKNRKLIICGSGDSENYVKESLNKDTRISFLSQVSNKEAKQIQNKADILINCRQNIESFTKYSFPSKNLEYLSTGNPVIAYMLDGIPNEYKEVLYVPKNDTEEELINTINKVSNMTEDEINKYRDKVENFLLNKTETRVGERIVDFLSRMRDDTNYEK